MMIKGAMGGCKLLDCLLRLVVLNIPNRISLIDLIALNLILLLIVLFVAYRISLYYPTVILNDVRRLVVLDVTD